MLGDALDYPTTGDKGPAALFVGGLLVGVRSAGVFAAFVFFPIGASTLESWPATITSLAVVLVVEAALRGYRVRALRATAEDSEATAPGFRPVPALYREGLLAVGIATVYVLPAIALGLITVGGNATAAIQNPQAAFARGVARNVAGLALLFGLLYLVAMTYVLPAAMTNFARRKDWRAAFRLRAVTDGAFSEDYAVAWLASVVLQAITYPVSLFLWLLLLGPFVQFFAAVSTRYLWGYGFSRGLGLESSTEATRNTGRDQSGRYDETQNDSVAGAAGESADGWEASSTADWIEGQELRSGEDVSGAGDDMSIVDDGDAGTGVQPGAENPGETEASSENNTSDEDDKQDDPMASEFDR